MKELGLNFSPWYCECLGLDWKETLAAICELNPKIVRISAYFNKIVPDNDKDYDFDELDYLVDFLKQRKIKIILTVGIKAQRWPEFFIPKWMLHGFETPSSFFKELNSLKLYAIQENILKIIEKIVERYKSDIIFWQVENEPLQQSVPFLQAISAHFLNKEIEAVKKISASGKILLNETILTNNTLHRLNKLSKQFRINTGIEKFGEINAANVYSIMALNIYGRKLELLSHKKFNDVSNFKIITELQGEPWPFPSKSHSNVKNKVWKCMKSGNWENMKEIVSEYDIIASTTNTKPNKSFNPNILNESYNIVKDSDLEYILFWGSEYWVYKFINGDKSWIEQYNAIADNN